jgi:hypothetical protein
MYHTSVSPHFSTTRRARVGVTTVFYTPGQALPGATTPAVVQAPSAPIVYRIPAALVPAITSQPTTMLPGPVYTPPAAAGTALTSNTTPGGIAQLQDFLAAQAAGGQSASSSAAQATSPPPALDGPVSNADGSPAGGPSIVPLVLIAAGLYFLFS